MIPLVRPELPGLSRIDHYLSKSRSLGKLSNFGPCYDELQIRLYELTKKYSVPVTSGTAAIQIAAQVMFPGGSRILMSDYTHIGTLQALVSAGVTPVLVPASKSTWVMNSGILATLDPELYDGVCINSPFGYAVDFGFFDNVCKEKGKPIIYDLAGGFGMKLSTKNPVCFSMHATKNIPIGEGGIVCFSSQAEADLAKRLSCFDQRADRTIVSPFGNNLKLDEVRCAVALAQLEDINRIMDRIERKRALVDLYQEILGGNICTPHSLHKGESQPSLCVLSGLPAERLEKISPMLGFEVKQYYPLLSNMEGLSDITRLAPSSPFFRTCAALPSDVTDQTARIICKRLIDECARSTGHLH